MDRAVFFAAVIAQQAACFGKQAFKSRHLAKEVATRTNRRRDGTLGTYRCVHCDAWHIGNSDTKSSM